MISVKGEVDSDSFKRFYRFMKNIGEDNKALKPLENRALKRTVKRLETIGRRNLAKSNKLAVARLRGAKRYNKKIDKKNRAGSVWFGLEPMQAGDFGQPRKLKSGLVKVKGKTYPNSFIIDKKGPSGRSGIVVHRKGPSRYPMTKTRTPIAIPADDILKYPEAMAIYDEELKKELQKHLNKQK